MQCALIILKPSPLPQSKEKFSFTKLVPGAETVGDGCSKPHFSPFPRKLSL